MCLSLVDLRVPVRVIVERHEAFGRLADVPEFGLAVVAARGQIVLLVRIEVHVAHHMRMRVLYQVALSVCKNRKPPEF